MADPVTIVETVCTTIVAGGVVAPFAWKRFGKVAAERHTDDLFLHGSPAVPGIRPVLETAGVRLENVERMVGEHGEILTDIQKSLKMSNGHTLGQTVEIAAKEARTAAAAAKDAAVAAASAAELAAVSAAERCEAHRTARPRRAQTGGTNDNP